MSVYEDKYLREKVNRIIAKQRDGKVVIAAYKDGTGLLAREDLGELDRAAYPYDYTVGSFGFLKYDSDLGAYLFTAKPDAKLPPVLAKYKKLALAEAELDATTRVIQIQVGDTMVTFSGAQPWKGLYEILREVNEELLRTNAGIVVWKITKKEGQDVGLQERLFPSAVPKLRNGQAMSYVTGFAYDSDRNLAYVGLVGYKTSLESLRVTLMSNKPISMTQEDAGDVSLLPVEKYEQAWQPMPEYTSHHAAFIAHNALPAHPAVAPFGQDSPPTPLGPLSGSVAPGDPGGTPHGKDRGGDPTILAYRKLGCDLTLATVCCSITSFSCR